MTGRSVEVVVSEMFTASERLREAGQRLQDGLSAVDLETRQLLGSGWKGGAATAYGTAWDQWHGGAGQVIRGLQTMSELLTIAGKEYAKTDEQSGQMLDSTMQVEGSGVGSGGSPPPPGAGGQAPVTHESTLADQMGLEPSQPSSSPVDQLPGQVADGAAQAAQIASGAAQQAVQAAGEVVPQATQSAAESAPGDAQRPPADESPRAE